MKEKIILTLLSVTISQMVLSQPFGPPGAPCWPPPCVPIDGGITVFVLIAAFLGFKNLSKIKQ
tara:strand:- start:1134 stop:1322 length:189 start_codon:yes stop_codon:yes gene_type:complete